jgi:CheY-like chemotaxis protein
MPPLNEVTISWIEDDFDVIHSVMKPVLKEGVTLMPYYTYQDAITNVEEIRKSDLIILDAIIPPGSSGLTGGNLGIHLLRRFRTEFHIDLPVIVFSILANAQDVISTAELKELKAHSLPKGVTPDDLKSEILEVLGPR